MLIKFGGKKIMFTELKPDFKYLILHQMCLCNTVHNY